MNYRQLVIFIKVCETKNMTEAARFLCMTQPAVSQTIHDLEEFYHVTLFERMGRQLIITEAGSTLLEYAGNIRKLYREAQQNLRETEGVRTLRIGANLSVGKAMLMPFIRTFHEKYPDINVQVKVAGSKTLVQMLENYELDLGLMEDLENSSELIQRQFAKDHTLVVVWPDHPLLKKQLVSFQDLEHENFLLREKGSGVRDSFDHIMKVNNTYCHMLWECSSTEILVKAVQEQIGISVLPYQMIRESLENGSIVELKVEDLDLERNLNLVYHPRKTISKPLQEFMEIIQEYQS